jgi:hypothetical protein
VGGLVVSAFAIIGDVLKPKSFAGLFGAAPSVALATLGLTFATVGTYFATSEARSMMAGAVAFFGYASLASWLMMGPRLPDLPPTPPLVPQRCAAFSDELLVWCSIEATEGVDICDEEKCLEVGG